MAALDQFDEAAKTALRRADLLALTETAEISRDTCALLGRDVPNAAPLIISLFDRRALAANADAAPRWIEQASRWTATRNLALALAPRVRVNAIGLGWGEIDSEDVAAAALYLAGARAVTGQMIALGRDRKAKG